MTWDRVKEIGSGAIAWRVSFDGMPYEFVSKSSMEREYSGTTAGRYVGLNSRSIEIEEEVRLPLAEWRVGGMMIRIADVAGKASELFSREPVYVTSLTTSVTASDNAFVALSTTGFGDSGIFWIDSEAVAYEVDTDVDFINCSRGIFNTLPQYHYTEFGERLRLPEITDWPRSIEGQRVRIYAYGPGDDPLGDGTQVWLGVARTEPSFNGNSYSIVVDPLTSLLDAKLGVDLDRSYNLRGIYYPATAPLYMEIYESADAEFGTDAQARVLICGFWEDQQSFCNDVTEHIRDVLQNHPRAGSFTSDTYTSIGIRPAGVSWEFYYTTGPGTPRWVRATGSFGDQVLAAPRRISSVDGFLAIGPMDNLGNVVSTVSADTLYRQPLFGLDLLQIPGSVPRTTYGFGDNNGGIDISADESLDVDEAIHPRHRLYLTGTPLSSTTFTMIEWEANGSTDAGGPSPDQTIEATITNVDTSADFIDTDPSHGAFRNDTPGIATGANNPTIKFGRNVGSGTLSTFLISVTNDTPEFLNTGAHPYLRGDGALADFDLGSGDIALAAATRPIANNRGFSLLAATTLKELIVHECRLLGVFPCTGSDGRIRFRRLRVPVGAEVSSATITAPITKANKWLTLTKSAWGSYNTVDIKHAYDPAEDRHRGAIIHNRDVKAYGQTPFPRTLEIAPRSTDPRSWTLEDAESVCTLLFGLFAAPYRTLTIDVKLTHFGVLLGDAVRVEWSKIPNNDGTVRNALNVDTRIGLVYARKWKPMEAKGTLSILFQASNFAGYTPATVISVTAGTTNTTGPFTADVDANYFQAGTGADDYWETGDLVRVYKWASSTGSAQDATIVSATASTITFTTDANWAHAAWGGDWCLGARPSTALSADAQKSDMFIAQDDGRVYWSGDDDNAFVLPP